MAKRSMERQTALGSRDRRLSIPDGPQPRLRSGVKVLITDGARVMLIKETRSDGSSFWTFPGGGLRSGESPRSGLRREIDEELRCDAVIHDPLARLPYRHHTSPHLVTFYTVYRGSLIGEPRPNPAEGVLQYAWRRPPVSEDTLAPFRRLINTGEHVEGDL